MTVFDLSTISRENGTLPISSALRVDLVLIDGFCLFSVSAVLDTLSALARQQGNRVRHRCLSQNGQAVQSASGIAIGVQGRWHDLIAPDVVLVIGGTPADAPAHAAQLAPLWQGATLVGGLGGGLEVLAAAGMLGGRRFCVKWSERAGFAQRWPDLAPQEGRYIFDRGIVTAPEGAPMLSMISDLVARRFGPQAASTPLRQSDFGERRMGDEPQVAASRALQGTVAPQVERALRYLETHFATAEPLSDLDETNGLSRRQLERMFRRHVGLSPAKYLLEIRLMQGRSLLARASLSVESIARSTGFASARQFRAAFRRRYGVAPDRFSPSQSAQAEANLTPLSQLRAHWPSPARSCPA